MIDQVTYDMRVSGDGDFLAGYLERKPEDKAPGTLWERVAEGVDK